MGDLASRLVTAAAQAIHRYDNQAGLSANDIPSEHAKAEARAAVGAAFRTLAGHGFVLANARTGGIPTHLSLLADRVESDHT